MAEVNKIATENWDVGSEYKLRKRWIIRQFQPLKIFVGARVPRFVAMLTAISYIKTGLLILPFVFSHLLTSRIWHFSKNTL